MHRSGLYEQVLALPPHERASFLRRMLTDPSSSHHLLLSHAQRQLWFLSQFGNSTSAYNSPLVRRFLAPLDLAVLRASIEYVCQRHEVLRTRILSVDGEPMSLVSSQGPPFVVVNLQSTQSDQRELECRRLVDEEASYPFDLASDSLFRCVVFSVSADDFIVMINQHHIITDGWSSEIIEHELTETYRALRLGQQPQLPDLPVQYADYAAWQLEQLGTPRSQDVAKWWRESLAGAPTILNLPLDKPRPARQSFRGSTVSVLLSETITRSLIQVARQAGASPFMAFLALYSCMLAQFSDQDDLLVGYPSAGREERKFRCLTGMFVDTTVLRADLSGDPSFVDVLRRVRNHTLQGYAHHGVPFARLVEELGGTRTLDRNPVFQAFMAYHPAVTRTAMQLEGVSGDAVDFDAGSATFELDLAVEAQADGGTQLRLTYATDLFHRVSAEQMLSYVELLSRAISADPTTASLPISELAGRAHSSPSLDDSPAPSPSVHCLHDFLAPTVRRMPSAIAIRHGQEAVTYSQLDVAANRLAWHLQEQGVASETRVGICLTRSSRMLVAIVSVLKAGGAYVPLDPALPDQRIESLLRDAGVSVVLTEDCLLTRLPSSGPKLVSLDADSSVIAAFSAQQPPSMAGPNSLAYVLYTSGSTGRPKGVAVEHRSVVGLMDYYRSVLTPPEVAGVLASTPIGFDATILEYFATFSFGGTVILVDSVFDMHRLPSPSDVTLVQGVPTLFAELLRSGGLPDGVLTIMVSGEPLAGELVEKIYATSSVQRIYNIYGVTECTADATWNLVRRGDPDPDIGTPIPGMRCYVLDRDSRHVPEGVAGELYLAGPGVSRGYVNSHELTEQKFLPDPFAGRPGERMYRTGDLVRRRPDGHLQYLGRVDRQVKIDGCRVEPAEVEAALRQHPEVNDAVVVARTSPNGDTQLAGYIVAQSGDQVPSSLQGHINRQLPRYMRPASLTAMTSLPLNINGKLDVAALPEPAHSPPSPVISLSKVEREIVAIWQRVLRINEIGPHDDFFMIGGQSMLAMRLVTVIEEEFGVSLQVSVLFETPTVSAIAEAIENRLASPAPGSPALLRSDGSGNPLVVIHAVGGSLLPYRDLLLSASWERPVYGFDFSPPRNESIAPSISSLAEQYLDELHAAGFSGPLSLLGWSMGGAVAYEMACQAASRGVNVSALLLLDTPLGSANTPKDEGRLAVLYGQYLLEGRQDVAASDNATSNFDRITMAVDPVQELLDWGRKTGFLESRMTHTRLSEAIHSFSYNMHALDSYIPKPVRGLRCLYLKADDGIDDRDRPFHDLLGRSFSVCTVPGDHHTMLQVPQVSATASEIVAWLDAHEL